MNRTPINPTEWGLAYSMSQGEIVEGAKRTLHTSGQVDLHPDADAPLGVSPRHPGDIRGQIGAALGNIDAVLEKANMSRKNVLSLRFFTTDIDAFLENYDVYAEWIGAAGTAPPQSLLGVNRLVLPELMVEIEAVAAE
jgi:enamine deaminase RidA (YjgF/YER057c/UK114 family)